MNGDQFRAWLHAFSHGNNCNPLVMGILNYTPDSFSDGNQYYRLDAAIARIEAMLDEGVDMIDLGAESSRPGASQIDATEEMKRLLPLIAAIRTRSDICLSVDTHKPLVMQAAIQTGADWINDIGGLRHEEARTILAKLDVPVSVMHMRGELHNFGHDSAPHLDMRAELTSFFSARLSDIVAANIRPEHIIIDPGIGFGKNRAQNLALIRHLSDLRTFKRPILLGVSRKRFIGEVLDLEVAERKVGSLAANLIGYLQGANIIRTHDVRETKQMLMMAQAIMRENIG